MSILEQLMAESVDLGTARTLLANHSEQVAGVGSWALEVATGRLIWSENMFRLCGLEPGPVAPTIDDFLARIDPADRVAIQGSLSDVERSLARSGKVSYRLRTAQGEVRHIVGEVTVRTGSTGSDILIGVARDVTGELEAEREIAALVAVSETLRNWVELETSMRELLSVLASTLAFSRGALWLPIDDRLRARVIWTVGDDGPIAEHMATLSLGRGEGLAGRAWRDRHPITVPSASELEDYRFRQYAVAENLRGAIAVPLLAGGEVLGVLALAGSEELNVSPRLDATLTAIGYEIGGFLVRRLAELRPSGLTDRELEVLTLAARGATGREIAAALHVSPATVKRHFEHIYEKYEVDGRAAAVAKAVREGLVK